MNAIWKKSFTDFAGPGCEYPSETVRLGESEAKAILAELTTQLWQAPVWTGSGRQLGYRICNATTAWSTALFVDQQIVGFYHGSYLWIASAHRACGLSIPLILAAAGHRGGRCMPPDVVFQGYTAASLAAHRAAHCHAVLTALAEGQPVPAEVIAELHGAEQLPMENQPIKD